MKLNIYTVFDSAANAYLPPFTTSADGLARRAFSDSINDPNHHFHNHPMDYTLYNIGEFDDSCGLIKPADPITLGNGIEYKSEN